MRKALFLFFALLFNCLISGAVDFDNDKLMSLIAINPETATQDAITEMLGKPAKIEEYKNKTLWYYTHGNTKMVIRWSAKSGSFVKFSYKISLSEKTPLDNSLPRQLKSGATGFTQAVNLLGAPNDLVIKKKTQELHYAYQQKKLRLFFRDHVLVDYCLY